MNLSSSGKTHVGMKRSHNEDCLRIYRDEGLFVVADGMGGHASGEVASEMSAETIAAFYRATSLDEDITWPYKYNYTQTYQENRIRVGVEMSNQRIFQSSVYDMKLKGMGTTMVALSFYEDKCSIGHVGDSRVYLVRGEDLEQLTEDHSLLNDYMKLRPGGMTAEEIENFPHKNVIVRALGMKDSVEVDVITHKVCVGDVLLLCSDGLSGMITDQEMSDIILRMSRNADGMLNVDLDLMCDTLIEAANRNGGNDNITVLIVRCEPEYESDEINETNAPKLEKNNPFAPAWLNGDGGQKPALITTEEAMVVSSDSSDQMIEEEVATPAAEEAAPAVEAEAPAVEVEVSVAEAEASVAEAEALVAEEEITPLAEAVIPLAEAVTPVVEVEASVAEEEVSVAEEEVSVAEEDVSVAEAEVLVADAEVTSIDNKDVGEEPTASNTEVAAQGEGAQEESDDLDQTMSEQEDLIENDSPPVHVSSSEAETVMMQPDSNLADATLNLDSHSLHPGDEDLDALGAKTIVAKPSMNISESVTDSSSSSFDTVRVNPSQVKDFERINAQSQGTETVRLATELGLPTLQPMTKDEESSQEIDDLQTVRVMPTLNEVDDVDDADEVGEVDKVDEVDEVDEPKPIKVDFDTLKTVGDEDEDSDDQTEVVSVDYAEGELLNIKESTDETEQHLSALTDIEVKDHSITEGSETQTEDSDDDSGEGT